MESSSIRWGFNFGNWKPSRSEWTLAARCIQQEEKDRIGRLMFTIDGKASMAGRLLIRKVISDQLKIPWNDIQLSRTEKGKPYIAKNESHDAAAFPNFNFNISHTGSFVALAAERERDCGIDVMDLSRPVSRDIPDYFRMMNKQGTPHEWDTINAAGSESQQLDLFYRYWDEHPPAFKILTFSDLTSAVVPILPEDDDYWTLFASKREERSNRPKRDRKQLQTEG